MKMMMAIMVLAFGSMSFAEEACVPSSSVLCTINEVRTPSDNCDLYTLSTTFQPVSSFVVDADSDCSKNIDDTLAAAALSKLEASANALKAAGVCNVIINNVN